MVKKSLNFYVKSTRPSLNKMIYAFYLFFILALFTFIHIVKAIITLNFAQIKIEKKNIYRALFFFFVLLLSI